MKITPISTKQFVWWLSITAFAVLLWILIPELIGLAGGILGMSSIILMSQKECSSPLNLRQVFTSIAILAVIITIMIVLSRSISEEHELALSGFVKRPGFILPIWAGGVWQVHRRWRSRNEPSKPTNQEAQQAGSSNGG